MNPNYRRARFLKSAATPEQAPPDRGVEVAFAGRSNAGKSSALNALCDQKALARTSKTPGRTQLLNFFALDEDRRLVDLPGYGFARVSEAVKRRWQDAMADYLAGRRSLRGLVLVMDLRHPLKDYDRHMLQWARSADLPVHILLTKADKLSRGAAGAALQGVRRDLRSAGWDHAGVQLFSALRRQGLDQAHAVLDAWLGMDSGADAGQKKDPGS